MNESFYRRKMITSIDLLILIVMIGLVGLIYICSHNENLPYYGSEDYTFVMCVVGSGRSESFYCGTISNIDYQRWEVGERGTILVHHPKISNRGYRLNLESITRIVNYGSTPEWLPLNYHWTFR